MRCQLSEYYHAGEVLATKITKFGYHWDINEPLEIDTAKNLTGIKVIGADRTVRTSHLNKLC